VAIELGHAGPERKIDIDVIEPLAEGGVKFLKRIIEDVERVLARIKDKEG